MRPEPWFLPASNGADDEERLLPGDDRFRQRRVGRLQGKVFLAGKKTQERPALERHVIPNGSAQHGIAGLERVQHRAHRHRSRYLQRHVTLNVRQRAQMGGQDDEDHGSVCTSTDNTAGRSRTMGAQESPASADAYTWPPVVPKYTPQLSSESMAMASRNTLT